MLSKGSNPLLAHGVMPRLGPESIRRGLAWLLSRVATTVDPLAPHPALG
jgi:hypothetical protein